MNLEDFIIIDPVLTLLVISIFGLLGYVLIGETIFAPMDDDAVKKQILSMDCPTLKTNYLNPNAFAPTYNWESIDARQLLQDQYIGKCLH